MAGLPNFTGNKEMNVLAKRHYGLALRSMASSLRAIAGTDVELILRVVVMMTMYEVSFPGPQARADIWLRRLLRAPPGHSVQGRTSQPCADAPHGRRRYPEHLPPAPALTGRRSPWPPPDVLLHGLFVTGLLPTLVSGAEYAHSLLSRVPLRGWPPRTFFDWITLAGKWSRASIETRLRATTWWGGLFQLRYLYG
jgi:hypothetical protein